MHSRTLTPDESWSQGILRDPHKLSNFVQSPVQGTGFRAVTPKPRRGDRKSKSRSNSRIDAAHPSSSRVERGSTRERWGQRPNPNQHLFSRGSASPVPNPSEDLFCRAGSAAPLKGPGRAGEWGNSFLPGLLNSDYLEKRLSDREGGGVAEAPLASGSRTPRLLNKSSSDRAIVTGRQQTQQMKGSRPGSKQGSRGTIDVNTGTSLKSLALSPMNKHALTDKGANGGLLSSRPQSRNGLVNQNANSQPNLTLALPEFFMANEPMSTRLGERPATSGPDGLMFIAPVSKSDFHDPLVTPPGPLDPSPQTSDRSDDGRAPDADHDPAMMQHSKGQGKRWRGNPTERMQLLMNHCDTFHDMNAEPSPWAMKLMERYNLSPEDRPVSRRQPRGARGSRGQR